MGAVAAFLLLGICIISLIIAIVGITLGVYGESWWSKETRLGDFNAGLWKNCEEILGEYNCNNRKEMINFSGDGKGVHRQIRLILNKCF